MTQTNTLIELDKKVMRITELNNEVELSVIIPVYNKRNSINSVYNSLLSLITKDLGVQKFEIFFIDDFSSDDSLKVLASLKKDKRISVITHQKNLGQLKAIESGLKVSAGRVTAVYSCDMQNSFDTIVPLYKAILQGYDLAIAYRASRSDYGMKAFFSRLFFGIVGRLNKEMPIGGFDFGLFDYKIKEGLLLKDFDSIFIQLEVLMLARNVYYLPSNRGADKLDNSSWGYMARIKYAAKSIKYLWHK